MSNQSDLYAKAMAAMEANAQTHQRQAGVSGALGAAYITPPLQGTSPQQVIDYLLIHYGESLAQLQQLRGRVWQLEAVNDTHLQRRQEMCDTIENLRRVNEDLKGDIEDREERIKAMAPDEQFEVIGVYTARTKGVERELRRTLSHLAVASFDGKTTITVDLRGNGRKRANSGS